MTLPAVAVEKGRSSQLAMKWAVDSIANSPSITIIHVRNKPSFTEVCAEVTKEQADAELIRLYLPYKALCARKALVLREITLEGADIPKAIVDIINEYRITDLAVGASNKSALMRKFRSPDVPSCLLKAVPEFCSVYVISKGKPVTVRMSKNASSSASDTPGIRRMPPPPLSSNSPANQEDLVGRRSNARPNLRGSEAAAYLQQRTNRVSIDQLPEYLKSIRPAAQSKVHSAHSSQFKGSFDSSNRAQRSADNRNSYLDDLDLPEGHDFEYMSLGDSVEHFLESPSSSVSSMATQRRWYEAESRRLKRELEQTMELYNLACKEAVTARQEYKILQQWKLEETKKYEELKQSEEAALALAEMERQKCKAAMEAAEASRRIAEIETQKRKDAEITALRVAEEKKNASEAWAHNEIRYRKYTIDEIEVATSKFAADNKIGEGGYGPVFKGRLDHTPVAIKVLRPDAAQGRQQFQQEIEVLSCIRHPNMVLLLGACPEYGCLIYEYMDNGSLEDRLLQRGNTPPISWNLRFKIAAEIATALQFLHQTKPEPLVHRDLKPANILLDRNYVSKISDVGLARLVPPSIADSVTQYRITSAAGTFCYIDPEYQQTGMLGVKSDVYSFGVMLLQIITAKPPMGLTHVVGKAIEEGTFAQLLDPVITDWPLEEALTFAKLALKCAELRRKNRPDLGEVVLPVLHRLKRIGQISQYYSGKKISRRFNAQRRPHNYTNPQLRPQLQEQEQEQEKDLSNQTDRERCDGDGDGDGDDAEPGQI